jgi:hypothetical protein
MPTQETAALKSRAAQRDASKRATFEMLRSKKRAERELTFTIETATGKEEITFLFRAIGSQEYDALLTKNPPKSEQKADGATYNIHTFAPTLLAEVCAEPSMSKGEWSDIWDSPDWNRGEVMDLFFAAVNLCNQGMVIPPTVNV